MKTYLKVDEDYGLYPVDEKGVEYIYRRKVGQVLQCELKIVRNYENHKRFFAFLKTTFDMQEHFDNMEYYRYWITMKTGRFDTIVAPNGKTVYKAHSLSFADMGEDEFQILFSDAIDVFLKEFGNGLTQDALLEIIGYA